MTIAEWEQQAREFTKELMTEKQVRVSSIKESFDKEMQGHLSSK